MEIKKLSIIVPIYKKEPTIKKELESFYTILKSTPYEFEIIGVVDGTSLDRSFEEAKSLMHPEITILGYKSNKGKGQAIRYGMKHSSGDIVIFIDSGNDINPNGIIMLLEHMKWYNADIIIGSKLHPASKVDYTFNRKMLTLGYLFLTKLLFGLKLKTRDTQTGIKAFKKEVLEKVLDRLVVKKYAFDIEILVVAYVLGFNKIYDAPVEVNFDASESTINLKKFFIDKNGLWYFLIDTLAVWYRLNILDYYSDKRERIKIFDEELNLYINTGNVKEKKRQMIIDFTNKQAGKIISLLFNKNQHE